MMLEDQLGRVKEILVTQEKKYRWSSTRWKVGYRMLLVFSALLASAAAIISKLSFIPNHAGEDWSCSGLMKPDTHLGENARQNEVSDDQTTPYLFP
jgi:hypothetical protein